MINKQETHQTERLMMGEYVITKIKQELDTIPNLIENHMHMIDTLDKYFRSLVPEEDLVKVFNSKKSNHIFLKLALSESFTIKKGESFEGLFSNISLLELLKRKNKKDSDVFTNFNKFVVMYERSLTKDEDFLALMPDEVKSDVPFDFYSKELDRESSEIIEAYESSL